MSAPGCDESVAPPAVRRPTLAEVVKKTSDALRAGPMASRRESQGKIKPGGRR